VPAAIHVTPECLAGGALARVRSGDVILLDGEKGVLQAEVADAEWQARLPEIADLSEYHHGMGRDLFAAFRANALGAEEGAVTFYASEPQAKRSSAQAVPVHDHFVFAKGNAA
jgi:phosphogluconate dehydratase